MALEIYAHVKPRTFYMPADLTVVPGVSSVTIEEALDDISALASSLKITNLTPVNIQYVRYDSADQEIQEDAVCSETHEILLSAGGVYDFYLITLTSEVDGIKCIEYSGMDGETGEVSPGFGVTVLYDADGVQLLFAGLIIDQFADEKNIEIRSAAEAHRWLNDIMSGGAMLQQSIDITDLQLRYVAVNIGEETWLQPAWCFFSNEYPVFLFDASTGELLA